MNSRQGKDSSSSKNVPTLQHDEYTIGWISALPIELAAAEGMLDVIHGPLSIDAADTNTYTLGSIDSHNIVVACLPRGHYGTNNAATVASNMRRSFPCIDRWLLVGIGGAVPHPDTLDIRLGDVVVSDQVLQYDFGKTLGDGEFQMMSLPIRPSQELMTSVSKLQARHERESNQLEGLVTTMVERYPSMTAKFSRPAGPDYLFQSTTPHVESRVGCGACDMGGTVKRAGRRQDEPEPRVHYGIIASGNQVVKDAVTRDRLAAKHKIICFEMEAAGLMDSLRCLVIRGICDYSDSHKNKQWQGYAAAAAAAYAKELLTMLPPSQRTIIPPSESECKENLLHLLHFDWMDARQGAIKVAHQQTCEWLLKNGSYRQWTDPEEYSIHRGLFWIIGKPGTGKSTLLKFAYTQAQRNWQPMGDKAVVAFFFNARGTELEKTVGGMYRSILFQALDQIPSLQTAVLEKFENVVLGGSRRAWTAYMTQSSGWPTWQLKELLRTVVENLQHRHLLCFVDALDECDQDEVEDMVQFFFEELGDLASQIGTKLLVCLSSRHYPHLEISVTLRLVLERQAGHSADLEKYIQTRLKAGSGHMQRDISAQILRKSSGVFLWAVLVVDILNKEFRGGRLFAVTRRLNELPGDLSALFKDILARDRENMDDFLLGIQWILFAARPLTEKEFYYALVSGLDPEFKDAVRWDPDYVTLDHMERLVHSSTKGLAELTRPDEDDDRGHGKVKDGRFVQFIHESVRDFLLKDGGITDLIPDSHTLNILEPSSHDRLTKCCNSYITASSVDLGIPVDFGPDSDFPFMSYALQYQFHHSNKAAEAIPQLDYLSQCDRIVAGRAPAAQHLLHFAAKYNYASLLTEFLCVPDIDINIQSRRGWTALLVAVEHGNVDAVRVLISAPSVDVNRQNRWGESPLILALIRANLSIAQMLLASPSIDVNLRDKLGRTALYFAGRGTIDLLLNHPNTDINVTDNVGKSFLHHFVGRASPKRVAETVLQRHDFDSSILSITPSSNDVHENWDELVAMFRSKIAIRPQESREGR